MATESVLSKPESSKRDDSRWSFLEQSESRLWRNALLLLALLTAWAVTASWEHLHNLAVDLRGIPAGVVLLVGLFFAYTWGRRKEIQELRTYVRGLGQDRGEDPKAARIEQLYQVASQSQRGYRDMIDSFDDVVCSVGLDGQILSANRRLEDLCEERIEALIGRNIWEVLEEPDSDFAERESASFLDRRFWKGTLKVRVRKTGAIRYYEAAVHGIIRNCQLVGVSAVCRDTTRLRESEARFTELFETLQEGIYVCGADGQLLDANPALVQMLGYGASKELIGTAWQRLLAEPEVVDHREGEIVLLRKNGSRIICLNTCTPMFDARGETIRYQGTLIDITQRKAMAESLRSEQEFARTLVAGFPDIITTLDRAGRLTFVSPRITEVLGFDPDELLGHFLRDLIHEEDWPQVQKAMGALIDGIESTIAIEYRLFNKEGVARVVLTSASALAGADGLVTGLVACTHDLTERRRLEQQVIQTEKLAAMGRMVAGVAHEINNPLTVVLGASDLSSSRSQDPVVRRHFGLIHQQARRTAEIVQSLLSFARPPAPGRAPLDLDELIRRALRLHEYPLRVNGIKTEVRLAPGLLCVNGDAGQLIQVLINLITNSQQAIREVKDRGTIRVSSGRQNGRVWVSIQDDGPGIKKEVIGNIFEPFFSTKRPGQGTGLGLSICLAIVRDHGGSIETHDVPGGGTEFMITLPEADAKQFRPEIVTETAATHDDLQGKRILVIDDEQPILDLVEMALANRGMLVECCHSGDDALAMLARREFELILCDMRMPGMTAPEFYRQAENRLGEMARFILMTAEPLNPETMEFVKSRELPLLAKPFTIAGLLETLSASASGDPSRAQAQHVTAA